MTFTKERIYAQTKRVTKVNWSKDMKDYENYRKVYICTKTLPDRQYFQNVEKVLFFVIIQHLIRLTENLIY